MVAVIVSVENKLEFSLSECFQRGLDLVRKRCELIVDDQFAPLADKIKAALKTLGEGKLKFILNTHYHGDHTGGNVVFGPDAPIIAQTNVRKRLQQPPQGQQPAPKE